jgi:micrococcal nuclease
MLKGNRIFLAIIISAVIIGGFLYLAGKNLNTAVAPKNLSPQAQIQIKNISSSQSSSVVSCGAAENTIVTKVIDGDTVVVEGGYHVRLIGMDADETGYPCFTPAKNRLEELVLGKMVRLEKDKTDMDQYGRCLRYIFVNGENIDVQLAKEGLAVARFYNDVKYKPEIVQAEKDAQENKTGCKWSGNSQLAK